jgi:hypothetical protein
VEQQLENTSPAYQAFVTSMEVGYEKWHDGVGYDLVALRNVSEAERDALVPVLGQHLLSNPDWRDVEALAAIGTPSAIQALRGAIEFVDPRTRMYLEEQLMKVGEPANLESAIINALRQTTIGTGFSQALDMAEWNPSPRIQDTLLELALNGDDKKRIHCAALALYLGGKADAAFDWNHRPFFLRFSDPDRNVQIDAYKELCQRLGVEPTS